MRIRTKHLVSTFAGLIVIGVMAHTVVSQERDGAKPAAGAGGGPDAAMIEQWMKANAPGEQHALLKRLAGRFTADVTMKMTADGPEMKSKGEEVNEMILSDRYLKSDFSGDMMGMPFKGTNLAGYDTMKKKYISVWGDSMSTGLIASEGDADASGKVITYAGECPCPAEGGQMKKFRQMLTIQDNDHHDFEMFQAGADGKEFCGMKIKYTRAKQ